jgi:hypothetical protein
VRLILAVAALEQCVFVHFDEIDEGLDSEVGKRHDAVVVGAVDPEITPSSASISAATSNSQPSASFRP